MKFLEFAEKVAGRTITGVHPPVRADEGFQLILDDGSSIDVGFSGGEGGIDYEEDQVEPA